ncbi:hypothetical protein [Mycetocola sp. JXN-3]|uniref:hypothetical protein n=1 Tax=Mycetocola sp. JXN-3 TaxID=2116510 RepID=UPI00165D2590|nr:hypothetical protein [Mycetocola sp. JXN-3]
MKRIVPALALVLLLAGCAPTGKEAPSPSPSASQPSASSSPSETPSTDPGSPSETPSTPAPSSSPYKTPTPGKPVPVPPKVDSTGELAAQTQAALLTSLQVSSFKETCDIGAPYCYISALTEPSPGVVLVNFTSGAEPGNAGPLASAILSSVAANVPNLREVRTAVDGVQAGSATR